MTPEQLYDLHCETVGGGKYGHVHWDDLPLESRIQWQRFATKVNEAHNRVNSVEQEPQRGETVTETKAVQKLRSWI
jgi:hypothetical protein